MRASAVFALGLACVVGEVSALEIDPNVAPEINIGGRALVTIDVAHEQPPSDDGSHEHDHDSETTLNSADSSLNFGFSKYLFSDKDYAFGVIGVKTVESGSELDQELYVHQIYAGVGGARYEVRLGRTGLPVSLVSFPTVRDDDALEFTAVGNGLIDSHAEEYQMFGQQVTAQGWLTPLWSVTAAATARAETVTGGAVDTAAFNGQHLALSYDVPEAVHVGRGVRYAGFAIDRQELNDLGGGTGNDVTAYLGGLVWYLNDNPEADWSLDVQAIKVAGMTDVDLSEGYGRARANSRSLVAALRYGHRPALQTRWQAALMLGVKDYDDFDQARSVMIAPTLSWWLGSGVEVVGQLQHVRNDDYLAAQLDVETDHRVFLGLSFAFDYTMNESVGSRRGILANEHGMNTSGPVFGGH